MILGLDISTSIVGITVLDNKGQLKVCQSIDLRNKKLFTDLLSKADEMNHKLNNLQSQYNVNHIFIEEPFMFFSSGKSTAKTMAVLQNFNGIISWLCFRIFGLKPQYVSANQARKICGIKVPRGENSKKVVLQFVLDNVKDFSVEYTKHGNPRPGEADRADSWVVAKAGYDICIAKNLK